MESIDWKTNRCTPSLRGLKYFDELFLPCRNIFTFYLGFDRGDPLYDTGDAWNDLRKVHTLKTPACQNCLILILMDKAFGKNSRRALTWLGYSNDTQRTVLRDRLHLKVGKSISNWVALTLSLQ